MYQSSATTPLQQITTDGNTVTEPPNDQPAQQPSNQPGNDHSQQPISNQQPATSNQPTIKANTEIQKQIVWLSKSRYSRFMAYWSQDPAGICCVIRLWWMVDGTVDSLRYDATIYKRMQHILPGNYIFHHLSPIAHRTSPIAITHNPSPISIHRPSPYPTTSNHIQHTSNTSSPNPKPQTQTISNTKTSYFTM
ncbi:hypothetical protein BZA77DRAFT_344488 [Pyronema omphalodes]|nr:hypothetical protein BZA77DRAFT_344488 [Pyronema omphalodes]